MTAAPGRKVVLDKETVKGQKFGGAVIRNWSKMEGKSPRKGKTLAAIFCASSRDYCRLEAE
jgi:hypothetical protein